MGKPEKSVKKPTKKATSCNVPLKRKKNTKASNLKMKSFKKFSRGYNKLTLLKKANSEAIWKNMWRTSHESVRDEAENYGESSTSNVFKSIKFPSKDKLNINTSKHQKKVDKMTDSNKSKVVESLNYGNVFIERNQREECSVDLELKDNRNLMRDNRMKQENYLEIRQRRMMRKEQRRAFKNSRKGGNNELNDFILDLQNITSTSKINLCVINKSQALLMMCHPCSLYFFGVLYMKVLDGRFEVLGFSLDSRTGNTPIYSPLGTSRMRISTVDNGKRGKVTPEMLLNLGTSVEKVDEIMAKIRNTSCAVAILERNSSDLCSSVWPNFVEKYAEQKFLPQIENSHPSSIENILQSKFASNVDIADQNFFMDSPEWNKIVKYIFEGHNRVALCGGKSVGKSTLMRYLVNRCLSKCGSVLVIDCDPGQSEFVPPGCVSAVLVQSPLLGPHFTHLIQPERSVFVGEVDVNRNPYIYINSVENVTNDCRAQERFEHIPWIINTMGYPKGFGVVLTSTVLKIISPSVVVQINSTNENLNFPQQLTPAYVERNLFKSSNYTNKNNLFNYKFLEINSVFDRINVEISKKKRTQIKNYSAVVLRKIMVLSYFGKLLNKNVTTIFEVVPYMIDYTKINLTILNNDSELSEESMLDVFNGSLVALCRRDKDYKDELSKYECLGYGIVRGIDRLGKRLFLTTPVSENKMADVDSLVKGSICLPDVLYTKPPSTVTGRLPFTSLNITNELHRIVKREFRPKTKGKHARAVAH